MIIFLIRNHILNVPLDFTRRSIRHVLLLETDRAESESNLPTKKKGNVISIVYKSVLVKKLS